MTAPARSAPLLSVLDRSLVREGEPPGRALSETVSFARSVEEWGFHRFWVAEHHGVPGVAGAAPTVLAAAVASATSRIRVGTGGVMLPNHAPLVVAEQFGVLESLFPGRIDMGLGRSVGFVPAVRAALGADRAAADRFGDQLAELFRYFTGEAEVSAVPAEGLRVPAFVLAVGAGAEVAAAYGLPLVLGAHREEARTRAALDRYRAAFRPAPWAPAARPYVVLAVNAAVGATAEEAARTQLPEAWSTVRSRVRGVFAPLVPAGAVPLDSLTDREARYLAEARAGQLHGTADEVVSALYGLAGRLGADEVLLTLATYEPAERRASYRRLAEAAGLVPAPSATAGPATG
ncbi:MsnO8 family LLM class oxidoreductase [Streptomyces sp. AJS327]|uniref:MsnO8 family LLM class oxidoreductase n=1 Tax=Streptomyces sp. AJS327 TaxID=2545265 RepID=UPI0015E02DAC|nr:MsnO8 family LLM class oxidoreductase [Streptomyces sp. AJS327]MBA0052421.1 MsnO8 family LLM class oxidoreductase [Streptomyces sp. AJS327]